MADPLSNSVATAPEPARRPRASAGRRTSHPESDPRQPERPTGWYTRLKLEIARGFLWGWARLFSLRGLYLFGVAFGTLEYLINFKRRARFRAALARIFPEGVDADQSRRFTLTFFRRTRCDKLFYLVFDRLPREKLVKRIKFFGREHIDDALARGNGVYLMGSHTGSQHVLTLLLALLGYEGAAIRDRNESASRRFMQDRFLETFPEFRGARWLYADSFPRDIYRCFQENRIVGSALDVGRQRGQTLRTCPVEIFGEKREFLTGTLQIALRCRATVMQIFVVSRPNFYFRIIATPPLCVPDSNEHPDTPERLASILQAYADGIESHAREYPDNLSRI